MNEQKDLFRDTPLRLVVTRSRVNMEDDHVDLRMKDDKNVDSIFTLFTDLTGENNVNPKYCWTLVKSLLKIEFSVGSGSNLEYSVKRLVRGLGSNRSCSQCGCFAALACVLKYKVCPVETVLEVLEKEQKPPPGATKSEMKAVVAGCVLTCGAIIHSDLFGSLTEDVREKILKKLIEAGKKKSYLMPVIIQFLIDVVNRVDDKEFKNVVWPICKLELFKNLNDCDIDVFSLLLAFLKKNDRVINKFLHLNNMSSELIFEAIVKCLLNTPVKCDHPIYDGLGLFFCLNSSSFVKIWIKCVNENSNINSHKDSVLITIFSYIIKNLQGATIVPKLLTPKFLELIMQLLSLKKSKRPKDDCSNLAKFALNSMVTILCASNTSEDTRFETIKKLLFYPANLKFEMKTGTKCIYTLASKLSCDFVKKLVDIYEQIVSGEIKKKVENGAEENWNSKEKQHALHIFTKTLNHPSLKNEIHWKLCKVKLIFEISFLKKYQLTSEVQKCAKDCFYKAIMVQMPSLRDLLQFLNELASLVNNNIMNKELKTSKEVEDLWSKMYSVVEMLKNKLNKKLFTAVHILLIYMGLHLFVDYELAKGGIEELLSCYQHLKETQKKKLLGTQGAPHWTEVTVDLILSLLSRENRLWRHVVSCVFPQIVPHITSTALQQIIDALDPKSQNNILSHLSSDDSDVEGEGDSESSSTESEQSEESDSEGTCDEGKPNDQLRSAVRNALGYSAAHTDDESVDMDEMDEEEERRLNQSLSEAFRQFRSKSHGKKKKQTKEEEALTHFRLRVLDLIEIYVTNSPSMGSCLDLLLPLFDLLEISIKDHHQRPLQNRTDSMLKHISAVRSFSNIENVNQTIIKDVFQSIIGRKETSPLVFVEMSPRISDCTAFLVRCSQQLPSDDADIPLVNEYESLLKAFFQSRDFKLPISTFQAVLRMSWRGNFKIVGTLFQLLVSPNIRIFKKVKIIELLRIFYKNDKLHGFCDEASKSELNEVETNFVYNFVNFMSEYDENKLKSSEKMYLSFFSNVIVLITVIQSCSKKHRTENISEIMPPWKILVSKMADFELIINNKKTRSQLGNLANIFNVELSVKGKLKRKRTLSESSGHLEEGKENEKSEEMERKKKKKKISAEKRKLKKETRKLREEISSNGLAMVRFSVIDSSSLPEPEMEDKIEIEEEKQNDLKIPKKKRKKDFNGAPTGYANEVGEAFRSLVHRHWVTASYATAFSYVLADTADKTIKANQKEKNKPNYRSSKVVTAAVDTLIWQTLASVAIPGFTINRMCALTYFSLSKFTKLSGPTKKWTTTAVGLGSIPFIVKPIDTFVDFLLDKLMRPFFSD